MSDFTWAPLRGVVVDWSASQLAEFLDTFARVVGAYRRSDGRHAVVYVLDSASYAVPSGDAAGASVHLHSRNTRTPVPTGKPPEWDVWRGEAQEFFEDSLSALLVSEGHPPLRQCPEAFSYSDTGGGISAVSDAERHATASLEEAGIVGPSTALLRSRMLLDHIKEAHDLGHGWPDMLRIDNAGLAALDRAEEVARVAYRILLDEARRGLDLLTLTDMPKPSQRE